MGENKHIKELDAFAKKYIKEIKEESPSVDFTSNLMNLIQKENSAIYKATPLISTKIWIALVGVLAASILFVSRGTSLSWVKMPNLNFDFFSKIQIPNLFEGIAVSNTMLYSFFFLALMVFIQVYLLKNHYTKKLES